MARRVYLLLAVLFALLGAAVLVLHLTAPVADTGGGLLAPRPGFLGISWAEQTRVVWPFALWFLAALSGFFADHPQLCQSRRRVGAWRMLLLILTLIAIGHALVWIASLRLHQAYRSPVGTAMLLGSLCLALCVALGVWYLVELRAAARPPGAGETGAPSDQT
jgi:hypothetical protein